MFSMNAGNIVTDVLISKAQELFGEVDFAENIQDLDSLTRRTPVSKAEQGTPLCVTTTLC